MADYDFSYFPSLDTPRLVLREVVPSDAADILEFRGDPEVQKTNDLASYQDVAEAHAHIVEIHKWFTEKKAVTWGVTLRGEDRVHGLIGFYFWDQQYYKTDLGYDLARRYWRQGITTEAILALLAFGFGKMHLHRMNVDTRVDNLASVRLMEKLGFHAEGVRRECIRNADGSYQSWGLYGMLAHEYQHRT